MFRARPIRSLLAAVFVLVGLAAASPTAEAQGSPASHRPAVVQAHGSTAGRPKPLPPARVCQPTSNWHRAACLPMLNPNFRPIASLPPGQMPPGLSPFDIRSAYKLAGTNGRGRTVAITVAHHNPNLESDLAVYRRQFHLRPCTTANGCLRVVNQNGGTTPPSTTDPTWAFEESLDVDAVSGRLPGLPHPGRRSRRRRPPQPVRRGRPGRRAGREVHQQQLAPAGGLVRGCLRLPLQPPRRGLYLRLG
jgi:hypothetical protein